MLILYFESSTVYLYRLISYMWSIHSILESCRVKESSGKTISMSFRFVGRLTFREWAVKISDVYHLIFANIFVDYPLKQVLENRCGKSLAVDSVSVVENLVTMNPPRAGGIFGENSMRNYWWDIPKVVSPKIEDRPLKIKCFGCIILEAIWFSPSSFVRWFGGWFSPFFVK